MSTPCTAPPRPAPNWELGFLDFRTAWHIAEAGVLHTTHRCSYVQTFGALLCDCGAIEREWQRRTGRATPAAEELTHA